MDGMFILKSFSSICLIDIFLISRKNVIFNELIVNNMNLENFFQLNFSYRMGQVSFTNEWILFNINYFFMEFYIPTQDRIWTLPLFHTVTDRATAFYKLVDGRENLI